MSEFRTVIRTRRGKSRTRSVSKQLCNVLTRDDLEKMQQGGPRPILDQYWTVVVYRAVKRTHKLVKPSFQLAPTRSLEQRLRAVGISKKVGPR